jgi:hypothetical protein
MGESVLKAPSLAIPEKGEALQLLRGLPLILEMLESQQKEPCR